MALNSTPRRRFGVALGVVLTGVTAGLMGFAGTASAHTPKLSAECKGETTTLNVNLSAYSGSKKKTNSVKITDGDTVLDEAEFKESYKDQFEVPGDVDHSFTVDVKAWDDVDGKHGWTFTKTIDVKACVTPPSTETTTTTTTTETTETTESSTPPSSETTTTTVETTTEAPSSSTSVPVTTTTTAEVEEEALASTGASIGLPLGIAGVLLVGGGALLFVVRRRSKA